MKFNPKGVFLWLALAAVAACYTFDIGKGVVAFGILAAGILLFG